MYSHHPTSFQALKDSFTKAMTAITSEITREQWTTFVKDFNNGGRHSLGVKYKPSNKFI